METLSVATESAKFEEVKDVKGGPVPNDEVVANIRASAQIQAPLFMKRSKVDGSFIFVGGGPSLLDKLEELRTRYLAGETICTSNNTHDFLIDQGIIPTYCCVIDPKEVVKTYIKKPHPHVIYLIGTVCNPAVAHQLLAARAENKAGPVMKLCVGYGLEDESDVKLQKELYPEVPGYSYLVGGTMMGLRAMPLATLMGYSKIEYYGFDSCFASNPPLVKEGEPGYEEIKAQNEGRHYWDPEAKVSYVLSEQGGVFYAYPKKRGENIQVAQTSDGRRFLTSPVMAHQAKQFVKWVDRLEGKLEVVVHGDSLSSHMLKLHREELERARQAINERRWTDEYRALQEQLHAQGEYGAHGDADIEMVGRAILGLYAQLRRPIKVLDYGCGQGKLKHALEEIFTDKLVHVTGYDPFVPEFAKEPIGPFDLVTCFDVFEHVEVQCVPNVFNHLASFVRYGALIFVNTEDAVKVLPNGQNAHVTQRSPQWWLNLIKTKLLPLEAAVHPAGVMVICQTETAKEMIDQERKGK